MKEQSITKTEAIRKINKMGQCGRIILNIAKAIVGVGIALCLFITIFLVFFPRDFLTLQLDGNAVFHINPAALNEDTNELKGAVLDSLQEYITDNLQTGSDFTYDGRSYKIVQADVTDDKLEITAACNLITVNSKHFLGLAGAALVTCIMTLITLIFATSLCKAFQSCASPFEQNVIVKLRHFAFALIPWGILNLSSDNLFESLLRGGMPYIMSVNLNIIFIILVVLALSYIFQYGSVLQQESDETL